MQRQGQSGGPEHAVRPGQLRAARLMTLQDGDLVAQKQISPVFHVSSRQDSRSHMITRVISRKTNRRNMIGDHHGRAADTQLRCSQQRMGFSARTPMRVTDQRPRSRLGAVDWLPGCLAVPDAAVAGRAGDAYWLGAGGRQAWVVEVGFWHRAVEADRLVGHRQ